MNRAVIVAFSLALGLGASGQSWKRRPPPHASGATPAAEAHSGWVFEVVPLPPPKPLAFEILVAGGKPCRIPSHRIPWFVHAGHPQALDVVDRAIAVWNEAGVQLGVGMFFQRTDNPQSADLLIQWSDPRLPPDKAAATWWDTGPEQRRVRGISMDGSMRVPDGNRAQILTHELGHVLGLGESDQGGDMMFYQMQRRRLRLSDVHLTERDRLALQWLYAQRRFAPIKGRRD
jgi:hypothetical protein